MAGLEFCYTNTRIAWITGLLSLSIPAWSVAAANIPGLSAIPIATAATLAVGLTAVKAIEQNKARRDSPWSYVISLRKELTKEDLIKQLQQGRMLI